MYIIISRQKLIVLRCFYVVIMNGKIQLQKVKSCLINVIQTKNIFMFLKMHNIRIFWTIHQMNINLN